MSRVLFDLQQSLACFVLHAAWQGTLLVLAAWIAVRLGRPEARRAHTLWVCTLGLCVLLPVLSSIAGRRAALAAQAEAHVTTGYVDAAELAGLPALHREPAWKRMLRRHGSLQPFAIVLGARQAEAVSTVYCVLVFLFALRMLAAWRRAALLVRAAVGRAVPEAWQQAWMAACAQAAVCAPDAWLSRGVAGPVLAGAIRPALLLPAGTVKTLAPEPMQAVLAHEAAHLRRHDPALHALCSLTLLPVCFHPAALWAAARIRQTREMACDAEAAERLCSRTQYARALLQVAERAGNSRVRFAGLGLFHMGLGLSGAGLEMFGQGGAMEERMQTILNTNGRENGQNGKVRAVVCAAVGVAAVTAACMVQVRPAFARERATVQAAAQGAAPAQEPSTVLLSGEHARQQLQHARRELDQAQQTAASDDARRKIATARQMLDVAEHQIRAAGDGSVDGLAGLSAAQVNSPEFRARIDAEVARSLARIQSPEFQNELRRIQEIDQAKIQADVRRSMDRLHSPELAAQLRAAQTIDSAKLESVVKAELERMQSPEFQEQLKMARTIDPAKLEAMVDDARRKGAAAAASLGRLQHAPAEERLTARLEPLLPMSPVTPAGSIAPLTARSGAMDDPHKVDSAVMAGNVLSKKQPVYPPEAKEKKIQGAVLLHAIIGEDGKVEQLSVVHSPDELLSRSALDAVRTWTYKPYLLNGKPTAVDTTITVTYSFSE